MPHTSSAVQFGIAKKKLTKYNSIWVLSVSSPRRPLHNMHHRIWSICSCRKETKTADLTCDLWRRRGWSSRTTRHKGDAQEWQKVTRSTHHTAPASQPAIETNDIKWVSGGQSKQYCCCCCCWCGCSKFSLVENWFREFAATITVDWLLGRVCDNGHDCSRFEAK